MTDNNIEIVKAFCERVLVINKNDDLFHGLTSDDKSFCDKHNENLKSFTISNEDMWDVYIIVQEYCIHYCNISLIQKQTPYAYWNTDANLEHLQSLYEYCEEIYSFRFSKTSFEIILNMMGLKVLAFQNNILYSNMISEIDVNRNIKMINALSVKITQTGNELSKVSQQITADFKKQLEEQSKTSETLFTTSIDAKIQTFEEKVNNDNSEREKKMHESSISILGIFSAIVLTFNGALAFSSSILDSISSVSIYKIVIVALVIGLVFVNILLALFYYLNKIRNGDSPDDNLQIVKERSKLYKWQVHIPNNLLPLIVSNIIIITLMLVTTISWMFGVAEHRHKRINNANMSIGQQIVLENNSSYFLESR